MRDDQTRPLVQGSFPLVGGADRRRVSRQLGDLRSRDPLALRLEACNRDHARDAVERWHYLGRVPSGTVAQYAVHERDRFIGAIVFGAGARFLNRSFGCEPREACELIRVALDRHDTPVSRIVSIALRLLQRDRPHLRLVVSYADASQGHHGGIYQAGAWTYVDSRSSHAYRVNGEIVHGRTLGSRYGTGGQSIGWLRANVDPKAERIDAGTKHRYLLGLDAEMRAAVKRMAGPPPKRAKQAMAGTPFGTAAARHRPARSSPRS